ncbi:MAG TPA: CBS domain-containing protein [Polyangiales bacterium]
MTYPMRVSEHLARTPALLDLDTPLAQAANTLREAQLECVPVVHNGTVCGVITARDLQLARALRAWEHGMRLRDLPLQHAYVTSPDASLSQVAHALVLHKVAYALVQEGDVLLGIVSWRDVASALGEIAAAATSGEADLPAPHVRDLILMEHANVRRLFRRVERAARRVLKSAVPSDAHLQDAYEAAHTLCRVMASELELEDHLLAPALEAVDAWGKVRADEMRRQHAEQQLVLRSYLRALDRLSTCDRSGQLLVPLLQELVDGLKDQLHAEEEGVLRCELLSDLPLAGAVETG